MKNFIRNLFAGPFPQHDQYVRPALQNQWRNIRTIWNNEQDATFGIERIFRLFIAFSAYIFPGIYIRHISGERGLLARKLAIDFYVFLKLIFPILILVFNLQNCPIILFIVCYLGLETLFYVAGLLFLSDIYKAPISHKRSYLMFMMNYVETSLDFAVLYIGFDLIKGVASPIDAAFFSFVTGFTIGYGDMVPCSSGGRTLVIFQALCSLFFITLAFTKAVASFDTNHAKKDHVKKSSWQDWIKR
jgi:Ion channel